MRKPSLIIPCYATAIAIYLAIFPVLAQEVVPDNLFILQDFVDNFNHELRAGGNFGAFGEGVNLELEPEKGIGGSDAVSLVTDNKGISDFALLQKSFAPSTVFKFTPEGEIDGIEEKQFNTIDAKEFNTILYSVKRKIDPQGQDTVFPAVKLQIRIGDGGEKIVDKLFTTDPLDDLVELEENLKVPLSIANLINEEFEPLPEGVVEVIVVDKDKTWRTKRNDIMNKGRNGSYILTKGALQDTLIVSFEVKNRFPPGSTWTQTIATKIDDPLNPFEPIKLRLIGSVNEPARNGFERTSAAIEISESHSDLVPLLSEISAINIIMLPQDNPREEKYAILIDDIKFAETGVLEIFTDRVFTKLSDPTTIKIAARLTAKNGNLSGNEEIEFFVGTKDDPEPDTPTHTIPINNSGIASFDYIATSDSGMFKIRAKVKE